MIRLDPIAKTYGLSAAALAIGLLLQPACVSIPQPPRPPDVERIVAVADLIGLSWADVVKSLGAREPDHDYVSKARLDPDGEIVTRNTQDLVSGGGTCMARSSLRLRVQDDRPFVSSPRFVFHQGRLQALLPQAADEPIDTDRRLIVTCGASYAAEPLTPFGDLVAAPFTASAALGRLPATLDRASAEAALETLRLGEPPPGGLQAYAKTPPKDVEVMPQGPGKAVILIVLGRERPATRRAFARVEVAEGRIVSIAKERGNLLPCWLEADRAMRCADQARPF